MARRDSQDVERSERILEHTLAGHRMSLEDAVFLLEHGDLLSLGRAAALIAARRHPRGVVTFIIDRNINYTNICTSRCAFCAFYREKSHPEAYVLSKQEIFHKIEEAVALGATQIMLQGGLNPDLGLEYYLELLADIKSRYNVTLHSFSPPEVDHMARMSGLSARETIRRLHMAGLDSLPGGGAEILVDRVRRQISPRKISARRWLTIMEEAHHLGVRTTATMMMGSLEGLRDRVEHLDQIRRLQDRTGGFQAFILWTFEPGNTELGGRRASVIDYLKTLAVARLFLDNFANIQGSWVTQGPRIGQLTLAFGANDMGSIMIEENVVRATGVSHRMSVGEMVRLIRGAGKTPAQRDTQYQVLQVFE